MSEHTTLIVAGPASHNTDLLDEMKEVAGRLAAKLGATPAAAWFDQGKPTLLDTLHVAVTNGSTRIVIVPFLLQWSYPDQYVLPESVIAFARATPKVSIHLAAPIGLMTEIESTMHTRAFDALNSTPIADLAPSEYAAFTARGNAKPKPTAKPSFPPNAAHLLVCQGRTCLHAGALSLERAIRAEVSASGREKGEGRIQVTRTRCVGPCASAPVVTAYPSGDWFYGLTEDDAKSLVATVLDESNHSLDHRVYRPGHTSC